MRTDGTARNLYIPSPPDIVVAVYDSDTYIMPFFLSYSKCLFYFVRLFLAFIYVFYMYTIYLSFPYFQYRSDIHVLDRTQASLLRSDAFERVFAG